MLDRLSKIRLGIGVDTADWKGVSIDGIKDSLFLNQIRVYTLTSQTLVFSGNVKELACEENELSILDVTQTNVLEFLNCSDNELKALNVSSLSKLGEL